MSDPFPHQYDADIAWLGDSKATLTAPSCPALSGGPPPQFGGAPGAWSPEHLLLSAVNLCLMTTFMALAKKAGLPIGAYRGHAGGTLDKTREGIQFTAIHLRVEIECADDLRNQAETTLQYAERYCIVSRALKVPVELDAAIVASRDAGRWTGNFT